MMLRTCKPRLAVPLRYLGNHSSLLVRHALDRLRRSSRLLHSSYVSHNRNEFIKGPPITPHDKAPTTLLAVRGFCCGRGQGNEWPSVRPERQALKVLLKVLLMANNFF